jgi:hypothetical protein
VIIGHALKKQEGVAKRTHNREESVLAALVSCTVRAYSSVTATKPVSTTKDVLGKIGQTLIFKRG